MELCEIEASVNTGLEETAKNEVFEKFNITATSTMGRINFTMPIKDVKMVIHLQI